MLNQNILAKHDLTDMDKLILIFESEKETIKKNHPKL